MHEPRGPFRVAGFTCSAYLSPSADGPAQQREQRGQALVRGEVLDRDFFAIGIAQRHAPVRVQVSTRARHVLRAHVPDRINEGGDNQLRRGLRDVAVQTLNGFPLAGFCAVDAAVLMQSDGNLFKLKAIAARTVSMSSVRRPSSERSVVWIPRI